MQQGPERPACTVKTGDKQLAELRRQLRRVRRRDAVGFVNKGEFAIATHFSKSRGNLTQHGPMNFGHVPARRAEFVE